MYQRFLFFGGSKHGERISVQEQEISLLVYLSAEILTGEHRAKRTTKELYCKQKWFIDGNSEYIFVLSSLIEGQLQTERAKF